MIRKSFAMGLVLLLAGVVFASDKEAVKLTGHVIDNMCIGDASGDKAAEKVKKHPVKCSLTENCLKSGFAIVTAEGKVYKLDDEGNKKVAELLKNTKTEKAFAVTVEGTVEGDVLKVKSISEGEASTK